MTFRQVLTQMRAEQRFYAELAKTPDTHTEQVVQWLQERYDNRRTLSWITPLIRIAHNLPAGDKTRVETLVENALASFESVGRVLASKKTSSEKLDEYTQWLNADAISLWVRIVENIAHTTNRF